MDCIDMVRQGIGRELSENEILGMFEQVKKVKRQINAGKKAAASAQEVMKAVDTWAGREAAAAIATKRALQIQMTRRLQAVERVVNTFPGREDKGLSALLVGSSHSKDGSRLSIDAMGKSLSAQYVGGFASDLKALGDEHFSLFKSGAIDRAVADALFSLDNPTAPEFKGPKQAQDIARIMHKWQESARVNKNKAGSWTGKIPGYIVRQSHDRGKIRVAGYDAWHNDIKDVLDWERVADGALETGEDAETFLRTVYDDIVSGVHLKTAPKENSLARTGVIGSAAARESRERVLHFKDGGAWYDYNEKYGRGNMREAYLYGLDHDAKTTALMQVLGPSPQANFQSIVSDVVQVLRARGDNEGVNRVQDAAGRYLKNQLREVDGTLNIEGNPSLALVGRIVRTVESLAKLGGAVISSGTDIPVFSSEFAYQGKNFLGSMLQGLGHFVQGRGSVEQQRVLSSLGVFFDSMSGDLSARFSGEELPGKLSALQQLFFRVNFLSWWTDSWKKSAGLMMSHDLALEKGLAWDGLKPQRQRVLTMYGLDAGQWDIIRSGETRGADGRDYLTPDAVYDAADAVFVDYLVRQGKEVTAGRVDELRDTIAGRLRTYFSDRVDYAVLTPDARTRATLRQGMSSGTLVGEAARVLTQFKSFPTAYMQRLGGREMFGRGSDRWGQALNNQHNEMGNFARLFLMTTLFGYGSMSVKQLLAGKTPRDPSDPKTWLAAAAQGGGLGIYGDFLFGESSRMGSSFYSTLAGPALGSVEELHSLYQRVRDGEDVSSSAVRFAVGHVPGNNIWWFRSAFDNLVMYNLYEMMNPGYLRRMRRRVEKENNQTFWMTPQKWW